MTVWPARNETKFTQLSEACSLHFNTQHFQIILHVFKTRASLPSFHRCLLHISPSRFSSQQLVHYVVCTLRLGQLPLLRTLSEKNHALNIALSWKCKSKLQNYTDDFLKLILLLFVWPSSFAGSRHFASQQEDSVLLLRGGTVTGGLTGWDRRFWLNGKVLGTSLKVNEQLTSTFNASMRIGSYNKSGVVSYFSYIWITKTMFVNNNSK